MAGNRKPGAMKQQQGKLGHRRTHFQLQGMIVRGAHAHMGLFPQIRSSGPDILQHPGRDSPRAFLRHSVRPLHPGNILPQRLQLPGAHAVQPLPIHPCQSLSIQPRFPGQPGTGAAQQQAAPVPVVSLRILQRIKHVRVPPAKLRMKQAVVGINEIMGRHRNAVAPHGVLPQGKTPLVRLRIMRPGLRHGWMKNGVIPGITAQQPFHHGIDNLEIGNGGGNMRIKTLRFRIIAHDQHSFLLRPFHAGTRIASGEQQHHTEHHEQAHGGILSGFLPPRKASRQEIRR